MRNLLILVLASLAACGTTQGTADGGDVTDVVADAPPHLSADEQALVGTWVVQRGWTPSAMLRVTLDFRADHTMTETIESLPACGVSQTTTITREWGASGGVFGLQLGACAITRSTTCTEAQGDQCAVNTDPSTNPYSVTSTTLTVTSGHLADTYTRQ